MSSSPPPATSRHLLVFPYPAQGHMLPLLDLTHQLASHGGFTLTVLVTPKNLPLLHPLLHAHPSSVRTLLLPFLAHPRLPAGVEHVSHIGNHGNFPIMLALRHLHDPILQWFDSHPSPPAAIISDFFLGWTQRLADHLQIPRIVFYSSGAFLVNVLDYCWTRVKSDDFRSSPVIEISDIPKSPLFRTENLPSMIRLYQDSDPDWNFVRDGMMANKSSWASVFNSFENLEQEHLEHLRKVRGEGRVFGVGPLSLNPVGNGRDRIRDSSSESDEVLKWLDGCPDGSVLYVCFGSQKQLNQRQIEALASGLEKSAARFVWVVKAIHQTDGGSSGRMPDRVSDRGFLVKEWAPQVAILSHRAVGGFLSHCGWNSVLESVVAGVMVLGWPMEADQFINARLLVEEMGVAVRVCEGADSVPDSDELGKVIAESLSGESPEKMKAKALKREAVNATGVNGSSWKDLNELINNLIQWMPRG